jgi:hypothetical protein
MMGIGRGVRRGGREMEGAGRDASLTRRVLGSVRIRAARPWLCLIAKVRQGGVTRVEGPAEVWAKVVTRRFAGGMVTWHRPLSPVLSRAPSWTKVERELQ